MTTQKDRLDPKPKPNNNGAAEGTFSVQVQPPNVKVGSPAVTVKVDAPQLNMDSAQFASAINELSAIVAQIAQQQNMVLQMLAEQLKTVSNVTPPDIKVAAPVIKLPPRPRSFGVEIEDGNGDTTYMRIVADSPN